MRKFLYMVTILVVVILAFAYGVGLYLKGFFPKVRGEEIVDVSAPVEILRDRWGIPHIYAKNLPDLFFAQGYVQAQDRLFQMDMFRRVAEGRLSEIVGEKAIELDRVWRAMRFKETAKAMVEELQPLQREYLDAYCRGVNAAIKANPKTLEFKILKMEFEPWRPENVIEILLMNSWLLSENFHQELAALKLANKFPVQTRDILFGFKPMGDETVEPEIKVENLKLLPGLALWQKMSSGAQSNNWVVGPKKSKSGFPLLANDPHLPVSFPSIWYEDHLVAPDFEVAGSSIAGTPFVILGHNRNVAWAFTNVMADNVDLVILETDPNNRKLYKTGNGWKEVETIREVVKIKGGGEKTVEVWWTDFGPLITDLESSGTQVALAWTGHKIRDSLKGFFYLDSARSAVDVDSAGREFAVISQNLVYADTSGNIGWHAFGAVPNRVGYSGFYPVSWDRFKWDGYISYEDMPHIENPADGVIVTANATSQNYDRPWKISHSFAEDYRYRRINELLLEKKMLELKDFAKIQQDTYTERAKIFQNLLSDFEPKSAEQGKLKDMIMQWDRTLSPESSGAAAYEVFRRYLWQEMLADEIGDAWPEYVFAFQMNHNPFDDLVQDKGGQFWDNVNTKEIEYWRTIVSNALDKAWAELNSKMGKDIKSWAWGQIHRVNFVHPFRVGWPIATLFNGGSVPYKGDDVTVNCGSFDHRNPYNAIFYSSYRHIIDMSDVAHAKTTITTGQTGLVGHPHYRDQIKSWATGYYHELFMDRKDIEQNLEAKLVLNPKASQ